MIASFVRFLVGARITNQPKTMIPRTLLILAALWLLAPQAYGQSLDGDRFSLSLGVFVTDRDTGARFDSDVDATKSGFQGALDWRYSGGLVFLKFDF